MAGSLISLPTIPHTNATPFPSFTSSHPNKNVRPEEWCHRRVAELMVGLHIVCPLRITYTTHMTYIESNAVSIAMLKK